MSQHDYVIENQDGASFRADINNALAAVVSLNSGLLEPVAPFAFMLWQDTTAGVLKQRNAANNAWVALPDALSIRQLTSGTAQATTSGTVKDFTGIPSWVKRITVMFNGVSTSGTTQLLVQLGTSGGVEITGYNGQFSNLFDAGGVNVGQLSAGVAAINGAAGNSYHGSIVFTNLSGNIWSFMGSIAPQQASSTTARISTVAGSKALAALLDRVRITTGNGTDTFDAGSVNILYE